MVNTRVNISDVDHEGVGGVLYEILCKKKWFPKLIKFRQDIKGIASGRIRKRSIPVQTPLPHKTLKWELANTPTRQLLSTTVVDNEAVVVVITI